MDLSWEAVLLAVFVVIPGFTYFAVGSFFIPPAKEKPSDFEATARSIAVSAFLLATEALVVIGISAIWPGLRHQIDSIVQDGLSSYVKHHTGWSIAGAALVVLLNTGLLALLAWTGPMNDLLSREAANRGFSTGRVWKSVTATLSRDGTVVAVRVFLTSGVAYHGAISAISTVGGDDTGPDIALWDPLVRLKDSQDWAEAGSAVVIPGAQIERFELYT